MEKQFKGSRPSALEEQRLRYIERDKEEIERLEKQVQTEESRGGGSGALEEQRLWYIEKDKKEIERLEKQVQTLERQVRNQAY